MGSGHPNILTGKTVAILNNGAKWYNFSPPRWSIIAPPLTRTVRLNSFLILWAVLLVEPPQRVVIGMLPSGQPKVGYLIPAGRLQLAAGAHAGHESVQPHAQQRTGMVGWGSEWSPSGCTPNSVQPSPSSASTNSATNHPG